LETHKKLKKKIIRKKTNCFYLIGILANEKKNAFDKILIIVFIFFFSE